MEKTCSLLVHFDKGTPALANEIKEALEGHDDAAKVDAMKKAVMLLLNGETLPQLFITIVRYVLPSEDHTVQKLLLLYLEIIDKTDSKGKILPEMILICQNLRNNLQHPNEYIRGVTLRFLCRLNETEIIEPLIPSILANLEHRHPYIRRNAILAVMAIYKLPQGEQLLVDAPEMIEKVLSTEADQSAKRNAFLMLFTCAQDRAVNYLLTHVDRVSEWGELLQMVVLELIRKVCRANKGEKGKYIKIIISLLSVPSAAVIYECAGTLVSLSSAPTSCRESFVQMLADKQLRETEELKAKAQVSHAQPDDLIDFYHLKSRKGMSQLELEDEVQDDLKRATGEFVKEGDDANKLNRILQLTGFSDPVYAEAYVTVNHYDIVLDVTVINRTKETLQNLCLELATMGDLKLVERPQNYTLAPESSKQIKANIKVSSTETGVIFGNIVYETSNVMERTVIVLNDIHIDIMDYISPAVCSDAAFRTMWAEFEWENKVAVNTVIQDEKEFLEHIIKSTNMKCLTAPSALEGDCGFLAANLYAKSVFGEDALVNLSIEKQGDGKLSGYIRIRSKTQGIALSLGDKITLKQKGGA
ncbi:putative clathrin/coatomer adaptor, adaptin-like, coatomer beta subunit, armadillo-like helical [Helianthus debilis subsp. tardiflorus]